jgi:transposase
LILYENNGDVAPKPHPGRDPTLDGEDLEWIKRQVEAQADIELKELCALLSQQRGKVVSEPTMCRACQQLDLRRKKKSHYAAEQDREEVKKSAKITSIPLRRVHRKR